MRIGVDIQTLNPRNPTGVGKYVISLLKHFSQSNKDDSINLYFPWGANSRSWISGNIGKRYKCRKGPIPRFLSAERFNSLWLDFYLPVRIKIDKIQVFHGPSFFLPPGNGARKIVTIHDISQVLYPELYLGISSGAIVERTRKAVQNADAVIADSEHTRLDVIDVYNLAPDKVKTIYLGVDDSYRQPVPDEFVRSIKRKHNLPDNFLLHIGSYHPRKNAKSLVSAMHILKSRKVNTHLLLLGKKTSYFESLAGMVHDLHLDDSVILKTYLPDEEIRALYAMASALVYPSLYEGFCLPVADAMASGLPCIVSDRACLPEIVGDAALIVPPDSPEKIAAAVVTVIENREIREKIIMAGREKAKQYLWSETANRTYDLYSEIVDA